MGRLELYFGDKICSKIWSDILCWRFANVSGGSLCIIKCLLQLCAFAGAFQLPSHFQDSLFDLFSSLHKPCSLSVPVRDFRKETRLTKMHALFWRSWEKGTTLKSLPQTLSSSLCLNSLIEQGCSLLRYLQMWPQSWGHPLFCFALWLWQQILSLSLSYSGIEFSVSVFLPLPGLFFSLHLSF